MRTNAQAPAPEGFRYQTDLLRVDEERDLMETLRQLPLKEYEFHGFTAKRRVMYYGWLYDSSENRLKESEPMPPFLHTLRERAAWFAELAAADLALAQVIEYRPGAAIGWHRDSDVFGDVIGISLLSSCSFRFRRKAAATGPAWERYSLTAEPRSIYLLQGPSRTEWQHSIPGVETLRYAIIFRTLR